jgi:hypothetical protein
LLKTAAVAIDADVAQGQVATNTLGIDDQRCILDGHRNGEVATAAPPCERTEAPSSVDTATGMHDGPHNPQRRDLRITRHEILDPRATRHPRLLDREKGVAARRLSGIDD